MVNCPRWLALGITATKSISTMMDEKIKTPTHDIKSWQALCTDDCTIDPFKTKAVSHSPSKTPLPKNKITSLSLPFYGASGEPLSAKDAIKAAKSLSFFRRIDQPQVCRCQKRRNHQKRNRLAAKACVHSRETCFDSVISAQHE